MSATASSEVDRQFALETVGTLRAWDNMDGLFAEYVAEAYKGYFARQSRFMLRDLSKADAILSGSKLPYHKLIEDNQVLGQLARSLRAESVIRTKVYKEGYRYRFVLEWLHSPRMDLIASETFSLDEQDGQRKFGLNEIRGSIEKALDSLIGKVPFRANVTGRDDQSVTVNIGAADNLHPGDILVIQTLEEVKKHPLLKEIVDWRFAPTGRVRVETVDEGISFGKVIEEESGRRIGRYQKVTQILPAPPPPLQQTTIPGQSEVEKKAEPARLGWAAPSLFVGSYSRESGYIDSADGTAKTVSGSGILYGARADGQLWILRSWSLDLTLGYAMASSVTLSQLLYRAGISYTYFASPGVAGAKAWVRAGYQSISYGLPTSDANRTGESGFAGPVVGIGADLPLRDRYGAMLTLDFGLFTSGSETGYAPSAAASATSVSIYAGGYYRLDGDRALVRLGFDINANNLDREDATTLTHRAIGFGPSLVYYF